MIASLSSCVRHAGNVFSLVAGRLFNGKSITFSGLRDGKARIHAGSLDGRKRLSSDLTINTIVQKSLAVKSALALSETGGDNAQI